jgi:hypothetical protein
MAVVSEDDRGGPLPGERRRRRVTPGSVAAALFGAALFAITLRQTRLDEVVAGMQSVGWGFLVVILLSGLRLFVRAWAWTLCTPPEAGLRVRDTFPAFLTGDALGNLTPLGLFASEATKAVYVRHRVPLGVAVSGLTIENLIYTMTVAVVIVAGTVALLHNFRVSHNVEVIFVASVGVMLAMLVAAAFVVGRQIKVMTGILDWLHRRSLAPHALSGRLEKLRTLEDTVYRFHRQNPARLFSVVALEGLYHAAGVAEVFVTLAWIIAPPTLLVAFILETANRLTNVVFKFVPLRLGVDEAGSALFTTVLGYTSATGATLALVRKVRMLFWTAVGVFFLARWRSAGA